MAQAAKPPVPAPAPAPAVGTLDSTDTLLKQAYIRQVESEEESKKLGEQQSAEINKRLDALQKEMVPPDVETRTFDEASMPADAVSRDVTNANKFYLNLHKLAQPPKEEIQDRAAAFKKFLPLIAAFAALGTVASRGNVAVGIQAMAGGLRGLLEGDREKYEQAYQVWKQTTDAAIQDNQMRVQAMRDILNDRSLTVSQQLAALNIYAHETPVLQKAIQNHDVKTVGDMVGALSRATDAATRAHKDATDALKPPAADVMGQVGNYAVSFLLKNGQDQGYFAAGQGLPTKDSVMSPYFQQAVAAITMQASRYVQQGMALPDAVQTAYGDLLKGNKFDWKAMKSELDNANYSWPKKP